MGIMVSNDGSGEYWCTDEEKCFHCGIPLMGVAVAVPVWKSGGAYKIHFFCPQNCASFAAKKYGFFETSSQRVSNFLVRFCEETPSNVRFWYPHPPEFKSGTMNLFDAARERPSVMGDDDRTVLAGRESFEGVSVGADVSVLLEEKDKNIVCEHDAFEFLEGLARAPDALDVDDKKLLESDDDE